MRRFWLAGRQQTQRGDRADDRLYEAAEADDWATVLKLSRRAARRAPENTALVCFAAEARLRLAGEKDQVRAAREAAEWLGAALQRSPRDPAVLALRGCAEQLAGNLAEAVAFWRRAYQADPTDPDIQETLTRAFVEADRLPEWGVPAVESTLLNESG